MTMMRMSSLFAILYTSYRIIRLLLISIRSTITSLQIVRSLGGFISMQQLVQLVNPLIPSDFPSPTEESIEMKVADLRQKSPPRHTEYSYTQWQRVIHCTFDGYYTLCGHPVFDVLSTRQATESNKNLCAGCFPRQEGKKREE